MLARRLLALLLSLIAISSGIAADRTWTSTDGRTMRAEFVREMDGEVTFLKDGKIVTLPLERLSERDRQIVRDLAAGKPVPEEPAPAAPPVKRAPAASAADETAESPPAESTRPKPLVNKPIPIENRTWTDIHGNQTTGKYVRIFGSNVVLSRGGRSITVKFHELTAADQDYLRELLASRGQEAIIPPRIDNVDSAAGDGASRTASPDLSPPTSNAAPPTDADGLAPAPGGPAFPQGVGAAPGLGGPTLPGPGAGFPGPGRSFPGSSGPAIPTPGGSTFPGPRGSAFPGADPGGLGGAAVPSDFGPPGFPGSGPAFPSASPPGLPAPGASPGGAPLDRFHQQMEESNRRQMDTLQQVRDQMDAQRESLFNRHGSTGECLNCKHNLNEAEMRRTSCPYCGVTWDYEIDEFGNKRQLSNSTLAAPFAAPNIAGGNGNAAVDTKTARMIGLAVGLFIGLAVVAGMVIGTIYIIMSIASASSSSQQRNYR